MTLKPIPWSIGEVETFLRLVSDERIQKELDGATRNEKIYRELSEQMFAHGYCRTSQQCRGKLKKMKSDYRMIKDRNARGESNRKEWKWFNQMDAIYGRPANSKGRGMDTASALLEAMMEDGTPKSHTTPIHVPPVTQPEPWPSGYPRVSSFYSLHDNDGPSTSNAVTSTAEQTTFKDNQLWTNKEVQALLMLWAKPAIQQELQLSMRNHQVYSCLSAKLALLGFNKAPNKCREKIKKLKQDYRRMKSGLCRVKSSNQWFSIVDEVLSSQASAATAQPSSALPFIPMQSVARNVDADDEAQWSPDEVQVLMTLWAQPNIQKQLLTTASDQVFTYLSSELALVGFNKTPRQCSIKVNSLKEEYKKVKQMEPHGVVKSDWFSILDGVFNPDGGTSKELDSWAVPAEPGSGMLQDVWTSDEERVLLTQWAEKSIQAQLRSNSRNEIAFAQLSSELATQGFDKTTNQCRSRIRLLTQRYRRLKGQKESEKQKSRWFVIMDGVLSCSKRKYERKSVRNSEPACLPTSQRNLPDAVDGGRLSVSSLCLLVPTLRLMCAFAWHVVQCCDVAHYGKVEELVKLVTEVAPELLTARERVQLLLRLRARLVLELCLSESEANLLNIQPHLKVIEDLTLSSSSDQKDVAELENSKSNFVEVVRAILEDPEERQRFFKDVFPVYYGTQYEDTLDALVWKFISRLDNLLPVPDIRQTAEWLESAPSVTEECARLILEPDQLKALLNFQEEQSGNTNKGCSQENMFLPKLSLTPKGNLQLVSEQQMNFSNDKDEGHLDHREAEKPAEENQASEKGPVEDCSEEKLIDEQASEKGPVEDCSEEKLIDEQSSNETPSHCSDVNSTPLQLHNCSLCPHIDGDVPEILKHIGEEHLTQESTHVPITEPGKNHKMQTDTCEYCGKRFEDVSALTRHIKRHTLSFHCDKCGKKCPSQRSLTVHRRIHTGERPYLCSYCGRGFRASDLLAMHVRTHTGDHRYKCHICGKTSVQHLLRHMRMHRGEKNFLCTECGKAFLTFAELRLHMRCHTGERPYTCKQCGKGFSAKCRLTVHFRVHTGETPYRCSVCPKSFRTLKAQKRHLKIHSSKKSFQCLKCGKVFRQEETFKMHVETHK